jgi:hypothetical protein
MTRPITCVECRGCHAIWQLQEVRTGQEAKVNKQIPSNVIEKLVLIRCPICQSYAGKQEEGNIEREERK